MKTHTLIAVALLATLPYTLAGANAKAADTVTWMSGKDGCHALLTERECREHGDTLNSYDSFAKRYAYLAEQGIDMRERESLCNCRNAPASVDYPQRRRHVGAADRSTPRRRANAMPARIAFS
jgi:hypothetical protein